MIARSFELKNDHFYSKEDHEKKLGPKVSYFNVFGSLLYLAQCIKPDIAFAINLLARFSSTLTRIHWNGIKHILCYLCEKINLDLLKKIR